MWPMNRGDLAQAPWTSRLHAFGVGNYMDGLPKRMTAVGLAELQDVVGRQKSVRFKLLAHRRGGDR